MLGSPASTLLQLPLRSPQHSGEYLSPIPLAPRLRSPDQALAAAHTAPAAPPHQEPASNQSTQQLVVAQWLTKTVMAFEFTGVKGSPIFFSSIERQVFMRSLAIPAGTLMFLGSYVGSHQMFARETRPAFQDADADLSSRDEMRGYSVTFAIKHLALQIITFRRPENPSSGVDTIQIRGDWSSAEVQIWPLVDDTVRWPPPEHFDDEGFDLFVNRWRPSE
jgi:hypothetical protein